MNLRPLAGLRAPALALAAVLAATGCADPSDRDTPVPVEGTTYRVSPPTVVAGSDLTVDILQDRKRCKQVFTNTDEWDERYFDSHEERIEYCLPTLDRASGQVQVSFRLAQADNKNRQLRMPLEKDNVQVLHLERDVPMFELEQFDPRVVPQLFILLIDHSASMRIEDDEGISRMQRVQNALWANRKTFINDKASVALFRFTDDVQGMEGQPWSEVQPLDSRQEFRDQLSKLGGITGWTHLYEAVGKAVGPLLDNQTAITRFLSENDMQPTVVLLTDGFNNQLAKDKCGTNAQRLTDTLSLVRTARRKELSKRPTLYTVGFGVGFRPGWEPLPDDINATPGKLCGEMAERRIDGDLDKARIDNVSLKWLAATGGGEAFVKSDHRELQKVFAETAPLRYGWYRIKYRVDPSYHRYAFDTRISISQFAAASGAVRFHPSAWFDAPTGSVPEGEEVWVRPGDVRQATAFAVPVLGGFILLTFLGPALFNARRAVFRRARRSRKKK